MEIYGLSFYALGAFPSNWVLIWKEVHFFFILLYISHIIQKLIDLDYHKFELARPTKGKLP